MARVEWKCPGCKVVYRVPTAEGLVLCPNCRVAPVNNKPTPRKPKSSRWTASDVAFVVISSAVLIGALTLIGIPFWNAMKPEKDPTKLLVRQWLHENLEDGKWEEVKWFPAKTVKGLQDLNLLHIVEAMEADKQKFERGELKEDKSAEYKELYNMVRVSEPRTFCGLKYRTSTLNGQAKTLRRQTFEIVDGKAKALPSNEIREVTSPLMKNFHNSVHDGIRYFDDPEYEPFPNEPLAGLESRLQVASIWKEPVRQFPVAPFAPVTPPAPHRAEIANVAPLRQIPALERSEPEIPPRIREYLDREAQIESAQIAILEKRIAGFETKLRNAKPSQMSDIQKRIDQTKDELAVTRRKRFIAAIPDEPLVDDIGALPVMEVIEVVNDDTALVRWFPHGKGRLPRIEVAVHPIERGRFKKGESVLNPDKTYRVTATKVEPSDTIKKLINAGKKPEFVVEETDTDTDEFGKWRVQYEKEMRSKK